MADSEKERPETLSHQVREKLIWFIFAILLAFGTSWVQTRLNVKTVQKQQKNVDDRLNKLEKNQDKIDREIERLKIRTEKISQKMDLLLQNEGLYKRYENQYRSEYPQ